MSLKSSLEFYKQAKYLYKDIADVYDQFQDKIVPEEKKDTLIDRTLNDINRLNSLLNKVNVRDFEENYSKEVIERTEHNIDFYYDAADYIEKSLLAEKYYDSLFHSAKNYFKTTTMDTLDMKIYAKDDDEFIKKFVATILHPNNISQFINQIKRMAIGTMSKNEFKKIYVSVKSRMLKLSKAQFESFNDFKNENN